MGADGCRGAHGEHRHKHGRDCDRPDHEVKRGQAPAAQTNTARPASAAMRARGDRCRRWIRLEIREGEMADDVGTRALLVEIVLTTESCRRTPAGSVACINSL